MRPATRRTAELARAGWGAALLARPGVLPGQGRPDRRARVVIRVLGARQLFQGTSSALSPTPAVLAVGVWTDAVHALVGLVFAAVDRKRARPVVVDAGLGVALAVLGHRLDRGPWPVERPNRLERLSTRVLVGLPGAPRPPAAHVWASQATASVRGLLRG